MRIEERPFEGIREGSAVFVPLEGSLGALRRATRRSLLAGGEPARFRVAQEVVYYPGMVDMLLADGARFLREIEPCRANLTGADGGALRCVAMWDMREGLLLHEGAGGLRGACLPVCTRDEARAERDIAERLMELSRRAEPLRLRVEVPARPGPWRLQDILALLSEQLK